MEDLDQVEPAVQEAQQGRCLLCRLLLSPSFPFPPSGEIDQETESGGDQESEQSAAGSENHFGIDLSVAGRRDDRLEIHSQYHHARQLHLHHRQLQHR